MRPPLNRAETPLDMPSEGAGRSAPAPRRRTGFRPGSARRRSTPPRAPRRSRSQGSPAPRPRRRARRRGRSRSGDAAGCDVSCVRSARRGAVRCRWLNTVAGCCAGRSSAAAPGPCFPNGYGIAQARSRGRVRMNLSALPSVPGVQVRVRMRLGPGGRVAFANSFETQAVPSSVSDPLGARAASAEPAQRPDQDAAGRSAALAGRASTWARRAAASMATRMKPRPAPRLRRSLRCPAA